MVHARVVRPPQHGAKLTAIDTGAGERMPGVLRVVRDGSYVAVIATQEFQAVRAARAISDTAKWEGRLPPVDVYPHLLGLASQDTVIHDRDGANLGAAAIDAVYRRPYQMHGSIGPSCAVGLLEGGKLTVWSHTQGRLSAAWRDRRDARHGKGERSRHPHGRRGLLRPQRRRRRGRGCRVARAGDARGAPCACSGCAKRSIRGSRTGRRW
jgi:hypothetical protein